MIILYIEETTLICTNYSPLKKKDELSQRKLNKLRHTLVGVSKLLAKWAELLVTKWERQYFELESVTST